VTTDDDCPSVSVPRLQTSRLRLRELRQADLEAYAANQADPVAMKHMSGVHDRRTAWRTFSALAGNWMLQGIGWWAIERLHDLAYVGSVGVFYREGAGDLEMGWFVLRSHWRQGIAAEAGRAALDYAIGVLAAPRVTALIDPGNVASIAVGARLGFRYEKDVDFYGQPTSLYACGDTVSR